MINWCNAYIYASLGLIESKYHLRKGQHPECVRSTVRVKLTHLPLGSHICVSELGQHWFRQWLVAYSVPSHYLNQCWIIVNWTLRNKLQWNFNQNTKLFIHGNASENIICEMAAIINKVYVHDKDNYCTKKKKCSGYQSAVPTAKAELVSWELLVVSAVLIRNQVHQIHWNLSITTT